MGVGVLRSEAHYVGRSMHEQVQQSTRVEPGHNIIAHDSPPAGDSPFNPVGRWKLCNVQAAFQHECRGRQLPREWHAKNGDEKTGDFIPNKRATVLHTEYVITPLVQGDRCGDHPGSDCSMKRSRYKLHQPKQGDADQRHRYAARCRKMPQRSEGSQRQ